MGLFLIDQDQNRTKMQEMMVEKLKKEAGATSVDIKDISYDAGFLYFISEHYYEQIRNDCCFSQV